MAIVSDFIQTNKITALTIDMVQYTSIATQVMRVTTDFQGTAVSMPIASVGTLKDYTKDVDLVKEAVTDGAVNIPIDKDKYIMQVVDGFVDEKTAKSIVQQLVGTQADTMGEYIDAQGFATIFAGAGITGASYGVTTAPVSITTAALAEDYMATLKTALKTAKIPQSKWFAVLPVWLETLVMKSIAFSPASATQNEAITNGIVGKMYGIPLYSSTALPAGVAGGIIAGEEAVIAGSTKASDLLFSVKDTKNGDMMPARVGEYLAQFLSMGDGVNNADLLIAGVVTAV